MKVLKSGYQGDILLEITTELQMQRVLFVEGEINQEMADEFARQMMHLVMQDKDTPINVVINSCGGEIDSGLKMCDIVSACPCKVNAYCFGKAYSMAAILFESVNGTRNMVGNSKIMLHQPSVFGVQKGSAVEIEELSRQLNEKNDLLLAIVADKCRWDLEKLKEETVKDRYFDASEAQEIQLIDNAITFSEFMEICLSK